MAYGDKKCSRCEAFIKRGHGFAWVQKETLCLLCLEKHDRAKEQARMAKLAKEAKGEDDATDDSASTEIETEQE